MKYTLIITFILAVTSLHAQNISRTLANKEDREYFYNQLEKLFNTKLKFLKGKVNRNVNDFLLSRDTFFLYFPAKPENERDMLQVMEGQGTAFAGIFWREVLHEFPEFKIFSLSMPCNTGKNLTINYHYNKDGTISLFSQLQKHWITLVPQRKK